MKKVIFLVVIFAVLLADYGYGDEIRWVKVPVNIRDAHLNCIARDPEKAETLYIGTDSRLYKSSDNGSTWQIIFTCRGEQKGINDIKILEDSKIYIATKNGLYESFDYGKNWKMVFRDKRSDRRNVKSLALRDGKRIFYILTSSGLYEVNEKDASWKKIFTGSIEGEQEEEEFTDEEVAVLKKIAIDKENNLYLSTNKGIFKSPDEGKSWNKLSETGLSNRDINFCLVSKIDSDKIYAATNGGVFEYIKDENKWINLYSGLASTKIKSLSFNSRSEDFIFCLADNNVYKTVNEKDYLKALYSNFNNEPSVREVQNMAVSYAEVHPDKIRKWRRGAKLRGLFPRVTFGIDESKSDTYSLSTDPDRFPVVIGPDDLTTGWDLTFTWDMGDFIYNEIRSLRELSFQGKV